MFVRALGACVVLAWACATSQAASLKTPDRPSEGVRYVAEWAVQRADNAGRPFAVIDKVEGRIFVFDAQGRPKASAPALTGAAPGDHTVPGVGEKPIAAVLPEERTTPAGRFEVRMGFTPKGEDLLWVDYDAAVALHRVVTHVPAERRLQRLASPVSKDRRITYGCINVPVEFFDAVVKPTFAAGGIVYILPEKKSPQAFFNAGGEIAALH